MADDGGLGAGGRRAQIRVWAIAGALAVWLGVLITNAGLEAAALLPATRGEALAFRIPGGAWWALAPALAIGAGVADAWLTQGGRAAAGMLQRASGVVDRPNRWLGVLTGVLVTVMVLVVFGQTVARYVFSVGAIWVQESSVWMHATVFMLGAAYAMGVGAHVRIDIFSRRYSPRGKAVMELMGAGVFAAPFIWFIWTRSTPFVQRSWRMGESSAEVGGLPGLFLLKTVILAFCLAMTLAIMASALRALGVLIAPQTIQADPTIEAPHA